MGSCDRNMLAGGVATAIGGDGAAVVQVGGGAGDGKEGGEHASAAPNNSNTALSSAKGGKLSYPLRDSDVGPITRVELAVKQQDTSADGDTGGGGSQGNQASSGACLFVRQV